MTFTQLDSVFLNQKNSLVHQVTKELLDALEANSLSREAGRELAIEVLGAKDAWKTTDDLIEFLQKTSEGYPFLQKLYTDFQVSIKSDYASNELREKDNEKLEAIQTQLTKLSQSN